MIATYVLVHLYANKCINITSWVHVEIGHLWIFLGLPIVYSMNNLGINAWGRLTSPLSVFINYL